MHPALAPPRHQPRSLQRLLHPGVAQLDAMLSFQLLVKMLYVHVEILLPVEREYFLHGCRAHPPMRRLPSPPVHQTVVSLFLVALTPAPHVPVADPKDLGRLPRCNLFRHGLQHHVLYFHRPLHRGLRVRVHASHGLLPSPTEKRTYHLLSEPDISSATDSPQPSRLTCKAGVVHSASLCLEVRNEPGIAVGNCSGHAGRYSQWELCCSHEADVRMAMGKQLVDLRTVWADRLSLDYYLCYGAECGKRLCGSVAVHAHQGSSVWTAMGRRSHVVWSRDQPRGHGAGVRGDPGYYGFFWLVTSAGDPSP